MLTTLDDDDRSGFGPSLAFKKNDESVRQTRKLLHSELNFRAVTENHAGVIEENARRLCLSHIQRPEDFLKNIRKSATFDFTTSAWLIYWQYGSFYHNEGGIWAYRV